MNRDDITPEELDGLLVAFADNELDEPQFSEILELISDNSDLAAKVENFKFDLKEQFKSDQETFRIQFKKLYGEYL